MGVYDNEQILVVEDDVEFGRLLKSFLQTEGFQIDVCERGYQAPLRVRRLPPYLMILDILLLGLSANTIIL